MQTTELGIFYANCEPAGNELKELGLGTVEDLLSWSKPALVQRFGERLGVFLHLACRGIVSLLISLALCDLPVQL